MGCGHSHPLRNLLSLPWGYILGQWAWGGSFTHILSQSFSKCLPNAFRDPKLPFPPPRRASVRWPPSLGESDWTRGVSAFLKSPLLVSAGGRARGHQPASGAWPASAPSASTWLLLPSFFKLPRKAFQVSGTLFSSSQPSLSHSGSSGLDTPSRAVCR